MIWRYRVLRIRVVPDPVIGLGHQTLDVSLGEQLP